LPPVATKAAEYAVPLAIESQSEVRSDTVHDVVKPRSMRDDAKLTKSGSAAPAPRPAPHPALAVVLRSFRSKKPVLIVVVGLRNRRLKTLIANPSKAPE